MEVLFSFGLWLKQRRKQLDLTQADLAHRVGCSAMTIRKIEADERRPSRQMAELLADSLEIALADRPTFLKVARAELRVERLAKNAAAMSPNLPPFPAQNIGAEAISLPANSASDSPGSTPPHNLLLQATPLIGREAALADLQQRFSDPAARLLTIIGPGGIGKTRLALALAERYLQPASAFADGVYFISLAPVSGNEFIIPTIADAIGFTFYGATDPRLQLFTYLREKRLLLILDNLEHLLAGVNFLADLLQQAPATKLLITSRERLNLQAEWVFEIQGLPVPSAGEAGQLEDYGAARLFLQSAQRAQADFSVSPAERAAVAHICRLLEGLPLGIELAAAWVRALSCHEIAQEIERNLDFLTAAARDVPARHHSMRAVFDSSWELLTAEEQRVLRQLSVFRGGFRREAAAHVAGASLHELAGLVDKSLISPAVGGRYHLHELLRQFSTDKLAAIPAEQTATRTRHNNYFLGFLQERGAGLTGKTQKITLDEIQAEIENVRIAWTRAVKQGHVEVIDHALDSLYHFYWRRSHYQEGEEMFRRTVEHFLPQTPELHRPTPEESPVGRLLMRALARQGAFCVALGRYGLAKELLQNSLELAYRWAIQAEAAFCLHFLASIPLEQQEDFMAAEQLYQESLAIRQAVGDRSGMADTLEGLGRLNTGKGNYVIGKSYLQQSLNLLRETENQAGLASVLDALGLTATCLGENPAAEQYYRESLALFKDIGDRLGVALAIGGLGLVGWSWGGDRLTEAIQFVEESLAICREIGHQSHVQVRLAMLGHLSNSMGRYKEAQAYFQEAWDLTKQLGKKAEVSWILCGLGETAFSVGDFPAARSYLLEALETTRLPLILESLVGWATMLKKEADLLPAGAAASRVNYAQKQQAVEILSLVLNHPVAIHHYRDKTVRLLAELETELPSEVMAAGRERATTVEEMVRRIVLEARHGSNQPVS